MEFACARCGLLFSDKKHPRKFCSRSCANVSTGERLLGTGIPARERFWKFVQKSDGCWLWMGSKMPDGYGHFYPSNPGKMWLAHRFSYTDTFGDIPTGHHIHHRCSRRLCVRPDHLIAVTAKEHGIEHRSAKQSCLRGHKYTDDNTYVNKRGARECRECRRERANTSYANRLKSLFTHTQEP